MSFEDTTPYSHKKDKKDAIRKIKERKRNFERIGRLNEAKKCVSKLERIDEK